ncbi:MAG: GNAT family N-acetyltransferase [Nocardioidaceae bacterium]
MSGLPTEPFRLPAGSVTLRPTLVSDVEAALAMFDDPDMRQWYSGPTPLEASRIEEWCRSSSNWSEGRHATWAIADVEDRMIGNLSLVGIDLDSRTAMIAYRVTRGARGRSVATQAVRAATDWAFATLGLERVELEHAVANPASCRVADRAGYHLEGIKRSGFRADDGVRWDAHLHARLSSDPRPLLVSPSGR